MTKIEFIEGAVHVVTIPIVGFTPLSNYQASIQFRKVSVGPVVMEFNTANGSLAIVGQNIVMTILPIKSQKMAGMGKWQLALWINETDKIKFDSYDYNIINANNLP